MVTDRMAARRNRTHQVLDIDVSLRHQAQSFNQNGQTALDHRTGLPGAETRVRAGALRRAQLARIPPSRHAMHCSLWVPGSRAEPFFPLCPRRSSWIRCPTAGTVLQPARVTAYAPSGIIPTRSRRCELSSRACYCDKRRIAPTADLLQTDRRHRNPLHQYRSAAGSVVGCAMLPHSTRSG